jgi:hypothetical protein
MPVTDTSPAGWAVVIAELEGKHQSAQDHLQQLRAQKHELALDASTGGEEARKRLNRVNADLAKLSLEIDDLSMAIRAAQDQKKSAEDAVSAENEKQRQQNIATSMAQCHAWSQRVDEIMRDLASAFSEVRANLNEAEILMNDRERVPVQQLRTLFGPTLACAFYGLGDFIQLGQQATYITHRQPYARFVMGLIDRWIQRGEDEAEWRCQDGGGGG